MFSSNENGQRVPRGDGVGRPDSLVSGSPSCFLTVCLPPLPRRGWIALRDGLHIAVGSQLSAQGEGLGGQG